MVPVFITIVRNREFLPVQELSLFVVDLNAGTVSIQHISFSICCGKKSTDPHLCSFVGSLLHDSFWIFLDKQISVSLFIVIDSLFEYKFPKFTWKFHMRAHSWRSNLHNDIFRLLGQWKNAINAPRFLVLSKKLTLVTLLITIANEYFYRRVQ